jgi:hypothetical protein
MRRQVCVDGRINGVADAVVWGSHGEREGALAAELDCARARAQAARHRTLLTQPHLYQMYRDCLRPHKPCRPMSDTQP